MRPQNQSKVNVDMHTGSACQAPANIVRPWIWASAAPGVPVYQLSLVLIVPTHRGMAKLLNCRDILNIWNI